MTVVVPAEVVCNGQRAQRVFPVDAKPQEGERKKERARSGTWRVGGLSSDGEESANCLSPE